MSDLPYFENIMYRIGIAAGEGLVMYFILTELPKPLAEWFKEYRAWKAKRKEGHIEEIDGK